MMEHSVTAPWQGLANDPGGPIFGGPKGCLFLLLPPPPGGGGLPSARREALLPTIQTVETLVGKTELCGAPWSGGRRRPHLRWGGAHPEPHLGAALDNDVAADVAGHDDKRVLEVHGAALGVRQPPVLQDLEHRVEHVGVGLWVHGEALAGGSHPPGKNKRGNPPVQRKTGHGGSERVARVSNRLLL